MKYRRYRLYELVCCADVVVSGKITDIDTRVEWTPLPHRKPDSFTLEVEQTIIGQDVPKTLRVKCFENWTCASRWTTYATAQRVVLFLGKPMKGSNSYTILGAGDEGEMPLEGDIVFAHGYGIRGHMTPGARLDEAPVHGSSVPLAEFAAAVRGFREHISWDLDPERGIPAAIRPAGDFEQTKTYAASAPMARQLLADVRSADVWRGPVDPLPQLVLPAGIRTRRDGGSEFASRMCALGDVDGDGIVDLAAGDPYDDTIINQHGALRVLFLTADGEVKSKRLLTESKDSFPARMNEFAHLGQGLAPLGDIDGDGVPDLVVSAPGCGGSWEGRGSVWILCLNKDGAVKKAIALDGDDKLRELGVAIGSGLGESIAALGDLDGDGFPEIAIGNNPEFNKSEKDGRSVYLLSLGSGGVVRWARRIHDRRDGFTDGYSWFGEGLAGLGDVDGDNVPDLAVSNPYDSDGGEVRGAVWIVCLTKDGSIKSKRKISDWSGDFEGHLHDRADLGRELFSLGDVDGDGIPDLAASTWDGLWFLDLNRDGTVRESRVLPMDTRRESKTRRSFHSLLRMWPSPAAKGVRFILTGWVDEGTDSSPTLEWFVGIDAKGQLQSW